MSANNQTMVPTNLHEVAPSQLCRRVFSHFYDFVDLGVHLKILKKLSVPPKILKKWGCWFNNHDFLNQFKFICI